MNRRKFIKSTALTLPSVAVLGAISTQPSTYRSDTSLFTNEDMTEWCKKNGVYYAKDDELNKQFFSFQINYSHFYDPSLFNRDESLIHINEMCKNDSKIVVIDIYKSNNKKYHWRPENSIVIDFIAAFNTK